MPSVSIYRKGKCLSNYTLPTNDETRVGANQTNGIPLLADPDIFSYHAQLTKKGQAFTLEDKSGKGLKVNHLIKTEPVVLGNNDVIQIGSYSLIFNESNVYTQPLNAIKELQREEYQVVVVQGPDRGNRFVLEKGRTRVGRGSGHDINLSDPTVSSPHLDILNESSGLRIQDLESRNGTQVDGVTTKGTNVDISITIQIGKTLLKIVVNKPTHSFQTCGMDDIISSGKSQKMQKLFREIERFAREDFAVLILGESGSGKELIAQAIHKRSGNKKNIITVNCGSFPTRDLIVSELFGHEKGAFTGAITQHIGVFEQANNGTLFLDEVGEISLEIQPMLLRVIEGKPFKRLGGKEEIRSNCRIIAATNRDILKGVQNKIFREDLYYRLRVLELYIPPLRERKEDIPSLIEYFLCRINNEREKSVSISPEAVEKLIQHKWPGNVRELENLIQRTVLLCEGGMINPDDISFPAVPMNTGDQMNGVGELSRKEEMQKQEIEEALGKFPGEESKVEKMAQCLGLSIATVYNRMKRFGMKA